MGNKENRAGSSAARTVPLLVICDTHQLEMIVKFNVSEEELVLGLRNIGRETDDDLRQSMLRILIKQLIAGSHK